MEYTQEIMDNMDDDELRGLIEMHDEDPQGFTKNEIEVMGVTSDQVSDMIAFVRNHLIGEENKTWIK